MNRDKGKNTKKLNEFAAKLERQRKQHSLLDAQLFYLPQTEENRLKRQTQLRIFKVAYLYTFETSLADDIYQNLLPVYEKVRTPILDYEDLFKKCHEGTSEIEVQAYELLELIESIAYGTYGNSLSNLNHPSPWIEDLILSLCKDAQRKHALGFDWLMLTGGNSWEPPESTRINFQVPSEDTVEFKRLISEDLIEEALASLTDNLFPYHPTRETRQMAKDRIAKAFASKLETYLDKVEDLIRNDGYVQQKLKRSRNGAQYLHYEFLFLRIGRGMTYDQIADIFSETGGKPISAEAVRKAVDELAAHVGIDTSISDYIYFNDF